MHCKTFKEAVAIKQKRVPDAKAIEKPIEPTVSKKEKVEEKVEEEVKDED